MQHAKAQTQDVTHAETRFPAPDVLEQVRRILARGALGRSRRLPALLGYLVSRTLDGHEHRLKEFVIATEALERENTFDPRVDAAVRVEANRLRRRLRDYYLGAGRDDPIRIEIVPGSYVPRFQSNRGGLHGSAERTADSTPGPATQTACATRPSLTVLPFVHLGQSNRFRFLARVFAEELVGNLAVTCWLRVRTGGYFRSGGKRSGQRASQDTPPAYAIGGSVIEAGNRVRIFTQMTDAETGNVVLTHRHVQSLREALVETCNAARLVAAAVVRAISAAERVRATAISTDSIDAWSLYQRGSHHMYRFGKQDLRHARSWFRKAAAADPSFASPCGALAYTGFLDCVLGFDAAQDQVIADAIDAGRTAVARDDHDPMAHFGLARALSLAGALESTMAELQAAIELDANFGPAHLGVGAALSLSGQHREAIGALDTAIRLAPQDPILWTMENVRALAHLELGEFDEAVRFGRRACCHANTVPWAYLTLMSALANASRDEEADSVRRSLQVRWPDFSLPRFMEGNPFDVETTPRWHRGLREVWDR